VHIGMTFPNTGLKILDTNASNELTITPGSDLTADRTLTLTTGDADRTITLSGNPTLADWFDQAVKQASSPTFDDLTLSNPSNIYALSHDSFSGFEANEHIDHTSVTLTAGTGLSGGGDISANRTFAVDLNELTTETSIAADDFLAMVDVTDNGSGKITFANLESTLNHDNLTGFEANEHFTMLDEDEMASNSDTQAATQQSIKAYVDYSVTSLGASYYMLDTSSGVSDYKLCSLTPSEDTETYLEAADLSDNDYIGGWISDTGETPGVLLTGNFNFYITAEKITGTKTLKLYWKMYERKSDTSEVLIATSSITNEVTDKDTFVLPFLLTSDYIPESGSRIVGKIYASVSGGGNAPTVRIYYRGNTAARWDIPANSEVFRNIFVPYANAVQDVDLNGHSITGIDNITVADESWIGIGASDERIVFDTAGNISFMGCNVGVGIAAAERRLTVREDSSGSRTLLALYNADTTDGNAIVMSFRGDTTGTGARTFRELGTMKVTFVKHDDAIAASAYSFSNMVNGTPTKTLILDESGNVDVLFHDGSTAGLKLGGTLITKNAAEINDLEALVNLPSDEHLVGYWAFDDGSGSIAVDGSGNGNDGTLVNMEEADWVDGVVGKCLDFEAPEYINAGHDASLNLNTAGKITISVWVLANDLAGGDTYPRILGKSTAGSGASGYALSVNTDGTIYFFLDGSTAVSGATLNDDTWYHIVVTADGTNEKLYLNGDLVKTLSGGKTPGDGAAVDLYIGQDSGVANRRWNGKIDEVRIYNCALTPSEVKALFLYPAGNKGCRISTRQIGQSGDVVTETDETKFSHKMPITIDGTAYYVMLTQT